MSVCGVIFMSRVASYEMGRCRKSICMTQDSHKSMKCLAKPRFIRWQSLKISQNRNVSSNIKLRKVKSRRNFSWILFSSLFADAKNEWSFTWEREKKGVICNLFFTFILTTRRNLDWWYQFYGLATRNLNKKVFWVVVKVWNGEIKPWKLNVKKLFEGKFCTKFSKFYDSGK